MVLEKLLFGEPNCTWRPEEPPRPFPLHNFTSLPLVGPLCVSNHEDNSPDV